MEELVLGSDYMVLCSSKTNAGFHSFLQMKKKKIKIQEQILGLFG